MRGADQQLFAVGSVRPLALAAQASFEAPRVRACLSTMVCSGDPQNAATRSSTQKVAMLPIA